MGDILLEAFWLLIVGMGSAFFVLFLIGVSGKFLIVWVNASEVSEQKSSESLNKAEKAVLPVHLAVITATVEEVTRGEGKLHSIQKIEI